MTNNDWLSFYKNVREDFVRQEDKTYLCFASERFEMEWECNGHKRIIEDAASFLKETGIKGFCAGNAFLFDCLITDDSYDYPTETRKVRIQFLNWIINKLAQEQQ